MSDKFPLAEPDELSAVITQEDIDNGYVIVRCNGEEFNLALPPGIRVGDTYHIRMPYAAYTGEGA